MTPEEVRKINLMLVRGLQGLLRHPVRGHLDAHRCLRLRSASRTTTPTSQTCLIRPSVSGGCAQGAPTRRRGRAGCSADRGEGRALHAGDASAPAPKPTASRPNPQHRSWLQVRGRHPSVLRVQRPTPARAAAAAAAAACRPPCPRPSSRACQVVPRPVRQRHAHSQRQGQPAVLPQRRQCRGHVHHRGHGGAQGTQPAAGERGGGGAGELAQQFVQPPTCAGVPVAGGMGVAGPSLRSYLLQSLQRYPPPLTGVGQAA